MSLVYVKNKKNQTTYVYESTGYWDTEKQQARNKRTCIGKLVENEFVPNKNYLMREELKKASQTAPGPVPSIYSSRLFCGATTLFDQIGQRYGIVKDLSVCFPDDYKKILSIAYYLILEDRNPLSRFKKWSQTHVHPHGEVITSQRSSELFGRIGEDAKQQFFKRQADRRGETEYLAYDTTSISSYSKKIKQVKYGKNKDHDPLAQINLAMLCGHTSRMPVYYRKLSGNITDGSTIPHMLADLQFLQIQKVKLVMDRGFYSEKNLNFFYSNHYKFIIGARIGLKYVQEHLDPLRERLTSRACYHSGFQLGCCTTMSTWKHTEIKNRTNEAVISHKRIYVHLYYDQQRAVDDKLEFNTLLDSLEAELYSGKRKKSHSELYNQFYEIKKTPVRCIQLTPKQDAINKAQKNFGYFALLSNGIKDPVVALDIYHSKDIIEKSFGNLKERLNMRRTSVSSEQNLEGKLFVQFIALLFISEIDRVMKEHHLYKKFTLSELLDEFDIIERFQSPAKKPHIGEITKKQRELYELFGVDADSLI